VPQHECESVCGACMCVCARVRSSVSVPVSREYGCVGEVHVARAIARSPSLIPTRTHTHTLTRSLSHSLSCVCEVRLSRAIFETLLISNIDIRS